MKRTIRNVSVLVLLTAAGALASTLHTNGSQGDLSFSALFENLGGGLLQVTLTNTGVVAPDDENGVIGALFFNLSGDPVLSPVSLSLGPLSIVVNGSGDPSPNWRYETGLSGPGAATQGLSAAGYGLFGSKGNFCPGVNCGANLQGIDWGLVDSAYVAGSGNSSVAGHPMIQDTAVFVLSGIPLGFDPSTSVSNISVQYTATLSGANIPGIDAQSVPEPSSFLLIGAGLVLLGTLKKTTQSKFNLRD